MIEELESQWLNLSQVLDFIEEASYFATSFQLIETNFSVVGFDI